MSKHQKKNQKHRSGMVALVGRPNVGKSTLMNYMIGDKISIITPVAQTTRNQIRGIQNLPNAQIIFLDTPGIHHPRKALNRYMVDVAIRSLEEVDLILYLVDAKRPDPAVLQSKRKKVEETPGYEEDSFILDTLQKTQVPTFLVVNKVDLLSKKTALLPLIENYSRENEFAEVLPISATSGEGVDSLEKAILKYLPEGDALFPPEYSTDRAERFLVSEIIREKLIFQTRHELPHSTAVVIESLDESERPEYAEVHQVAQSGVANSLEALARELVTPPNEEEALALEEIEEKQDPLENRYNPDNRGEREPRELGPGLVRIHATIIVERKSQKGIVIGKKGALLKEVGTLARKEIELLLGCRIFLQLWVKVAKNWSKNEHALRKLGYDEPT